MGEPELIITELTTSPEKEPPDIAPKPVFNEPPVIAPAPAVIVLLFDVIVVQDNAPPTIAPVPVVRLLLVVFIAPELMIPHVTDPVPVTILLLVVDIAPVVVNALHSIAPVASMWATLFDKISLIVTPVPVTNPAPDIEALILPVGIASRIDRLDDDNVVATTSTHECSGTRTRIWQLKEKLQRLWHNTGFQYQKGNN